jgi:hypothetical protein
LSVEVLALESQRSQSCFAVVLDERSVLVLFESDPQFFFGIHHNRTVPGNRLTEGFSRYEQEAHGLALRRDSNLIAVSK